MTNTHFDMMIAKMPNQITRPVSGVQIRAEFICTDDKRWRDFLVAAPHDFYHLPEYVALEADQEGGQATAFYAERGAAKLLIPLLLRELPPTLAAPGHWRDAVNPYGYPSPLFLADKDSEQSDKTQFEILWHAFVRQAAAQNIVSVFLRLHPLMPLPAVLEKYGQLVQHGQTVYLDLEKSDDALNDLCRNHRRDIKKLSDAGFRVVIDEWKYYPHFIEIYRSTMKRLQAGQMYYFEGDYFARLRMALGEKLHLAAVIAPNGEVAAAEIFTTTCGIVQNHLAGTAEEFQRLAPTKLLTDYMRCWAQERGEKLFHMGGGLGGREDSLFRFKAGFSKLRADFFTYRLILDSTKYDRLIAMRQNAGGNVESDVESIDDFFPEYRRALL
jgi:hypothetical protein